MYFFLVFIALNEMTMWSDVELLINEDTNTVRYEGVSREDSGSGLYQVDTLVRISSSNKVILLLYFTVSSNTI